MYLTYFGLTERPFSITPDPRFLYLGERHREALSHLLYGISEHGGFVQLTGEVGTGKTTLWRYALQRLPPEVDVAVILNSRLTAIELLATLCDELRIEYPAGSTSAKTLVDALYRYLLDAHARGRRTVLIIDEAQNLSVDALEQVRMLTNLETARDKLLQIILIGQPELAQLLGRTELRQVAQRITARYHLLPFGERETRAYVLYRMQVAGQADRVFDDAALDEIHRVSAGIPRVINVVCDRALLGAYATQRADVDAALVRQAAREVFSSPADARPGGAAPWVRVAAAAGVVAVTVAVVGFGLASGRLTGAVDRVVRAVTPPAPSRAPVDPARSRPVVAAGPVVVTNASLADRESDVVAPRRADLTALLSTVSGSSSRATAFSRLHALWGVEVPGPVAATSCEGERPGGLACLVARGTWRVLRRLDVPAVIELVTARGERHHAVVTMLDAERAVVELGRERYTVPLDDLERSWDGRFTVLWKRPAVAGSSLALGTRGPAVTWLRRQLAVIDRTPLSERPSDVFDDDLQRRVMGFQRAQSLVPDGVVGDETLVRLTAVADAQAPSLSAARARR